MKMVREKRLPFRQPAHDDEPRRDEAAVQQCAPGLRPVAVVDLEATCQIDGQAADGSRSLLATMAAQGTNG